MDTNRTAPADHPMVPVSFFDPLSGRLVYSIVIGTTSDRCEALRAAYVVAKLRGVRVEQLTHRFI